MSNMNSKPWLLCYVLAFGHAYFTSHIRASI